MSYCTIAQLKARYDLRVIAQLSNDNNTESMDLANVQAALDDATSDIKMAAMRGRIYLESQLDALSTAGDPAIIRLCADLAMRHLSHRRAQGVDPALEQRWKSSLDMLQMIRDGGRIFDVAANRGAELPGLVEYTAQEMENLGSLTSTSFFGGGKKTPTVTG